MIPGNDDAIRSCHRRDQGDRRRDRGRQAQGDARRDAGREERQAAGARGGRDVPQPKRRRPRPRRLRAGAAPVADETPAADEPARPRPRRPPRRSRANDRDHGSDGQGAPRRDERRDDGVQARAAGDRRRLRRGGQAPAREGHGVGCEARRSRDERGQGRRDGARQRRRDRGDRLRDRAGLEQRRLPRATPRSVLEDRVRRRRRRGRRSRTSASRSRRSSARTSRSSARSAWRLRPTSTLAFYVHSPANKVGALVRTKGGDPAAARSLALHLTFARPTYGDAGRGAAGARRRRARDPLEVGRGALEARERPREDRRGPAEQAVLRRVRAHGADVVPRGRVQPAPSRST